MTETPTHVVSMGLDPSLDEAAKIALIVARTGLSREDADMLCSLAADLRITQTVNTVKGVHVLLEKRLLGPAGPASSQVPGDRACRARVRRRRFAWYFNIFRSIGAVEAPAVIADCALCC
ncbi:MAG TPA: hypothetical protein VFR34_14295 [Paracoccaceae bacterium]|nr:hypothetical protein [Paracoccaceae bacterium]